MIDIIISFTLGVVTGIGILSLYCAAAVHKKKD